MKLPIPSVQRQICIANYVRARDGKVFQCGSVVRNGVCNQRQHPQEDNTFTPFRGKANYVATDGKNPSRKPGGGIR